MSITIEYYDRENSFLLPSDAVNEIMVIMKRVGYQEVKVSDKLTFTAFAKGERS